MGSTLRKSTHSLDIYRLCWWMEVPTIFPDDLSKMCPNIWTHFGHLLDTFWTFCWRISFFWKVSKIVQNMTLVWTYFGRNQQTWTPFGHHLDTFWTLFGHIASMDMFWTYFGHILDTFWTFSYFLCPKCVHTHILKESQKLMDE